MLIKIQSAGFPCSSKAEGAYDIFMSWNGVKWRVSPTFQKFVVGPLHFYGRPTCIFNFSNTYIGFEDYFLQENGPILLLVIMPVCLCTVEKTWQCIRGQNSGKEEEKEWCSTWEELSTFLPQPSSPTETRGSCKE